MPNDRPRATRVVVGAALLALAMAAGLACSDGGEERTAPSDAPPSTSVDAGSSDGALVSTLAVEIGTGSSSFVALHDGDSIPMIRGKQGFQHVWISARVHETAARDAVATITTTLLSDGRAGGPPLSAAVTLAPSDAGGDEEITGLTGLVDYGVKGQRLRVRIDLVTADGLRGWDERTVLVLPPVEYECSTDAGATSCAALCGSLACATCEPGSSSVGYVGGADAEASLPSCESEIAVLPGQFACCCCR